MHQLKMDNSTTLILKVTCFLVFSQVVLSSEFRATGTFQLTLTSLPEFCAECDIRVEVCLKHYQNVIRNDGDCTLGKFLSRHFLGTEQLLATINPITIEFTSWPGTYSLIIRAVRNGDAAEEAVAAQEDGEQEVLVLTQGALSVGEMWREKQSTSGVGYSFRAVCDANYYGESCEIMCRNRNDHFGHYTCSEKGVKVCDEGWMGDYCNTAICLEGCHPQHGTCETPNECKCHIGYQGALCDKCIPYPGCKHGTCEDNSWQCMCEEGWGGLLCDLDLNYCTNHRPCKHGVCENTGMGGFTCTCEPNWTGEHCDFPLSSGNNIEKLPTTTTTKAPYTCDNVQCMNGGVCKNEESGRYSCQCTPQYRGTHCELPIPPKAVATSTTQRQVGEEGSDEDSSALTSFHIVVIIVISVLLPIALIGIVAIILCKRRISRREEQQMKKQNRQNQQQAMQNKLDNVLLDESLRCQKQSLPTMHHKPASAHLPSHAQLYSKHNDFSKSTKLNSSFSSTLTLQKVHNVPHSKSIDSGFGRDCLSSASSSSSPDRPPPQLHHHYQNTTSDCCMVDVLDDTTATSTLPDIFVISDTSCSSPGLLATEV